MLKFNNTHIFTGYIKQLLSSFNLPKYRVYTKEQERYFIEHGEESPTVIPTTLKTFHPVTQINPDVGTVDHTYYANYIKNNFIQRYINGKWENTNLHYHYNKHILNHTKQLVVKNNVYDSYTHEYLGEYLRFQRDYNNLDLMPLYNCFSNKICTNLDLDVKDIEGHILGTFKSADNACKIYMIPVKLFKTYTIAVECQDTVEIVCGVYHKYLNTSDKVKHVFETTYQRINNTRFEEPFLYTKLNFTPEEIESQVVTPELAQQESNLRLFIKLPYSNNSSITILEGDYLEYNDNRATVEPLIPEETDGSNSVIGVLKVQQNKTVINLEHINEADYDYNDLVFKPISELQLLRINTGESYPFADRLIEYLTDNVITNIDEIGDNVVRLQKVLTKNKIGCEVAGLWEDKYRIILYSAVSAGSLDNDVTLGRFDKMDCLGYVDKDTEQYYTYPQTYKTTKINSEGQEVAEFKTYHVSVARADIYEDIYKAQAEQIRKQREGK